MDYQFSLVITTYNNYDTFLKNTLPKYLNNPYIFEIIISDDCSDDYDKINNDYSSVSKIKLIKQPHNLGALKNKITACTYATLEWICLIDSDNYCGPDYFEALIHYWKNNSRETNIIYSPVHALPVFNFTKYIGTIFDKTYWKDIDACLINIGNNVFHKSAVDYLIPILKQDIEAYAVDVKYINYILFKNNLSLIVIPNMQYLHTMHDNSLYMRTASKSMEFDNTFDWIL